MAGARGEAIIQADGREIRVLYTNRGLAEAEQRLGRSILGVAEGMSTGTTGITEIALLLRAGMEAARRDAREPGPAVALNTAFDVLDTAGFAAVSVAVMEGVAAVLSYGVEEEAEGPNPP